MRFSFRTFIVAVTLLAGFGRADAAPYTALYAFGDSLSDVGNVQIATGGAIPGAPYANGRFSNGPNWADRLSSALGLGTLTPSLANGKDYAFGGAVTGPAVPGASTAVPNITQQVGLFTLATGGVASSTALYTMWIGANDIYTALDDLATSSITLNQAVADLIAAAATEANAVRALALEGAHTFLVPLVPDLGKTPAANGLNAVATALSQQYNAALAADLLAVTGALGTDIRLVDTFSLIDQAVTNPSAFGFTNVTDPCYVGTLAGGGTVCATPNSYLFWDVEHPTTAADAFITRAALQALGIPEPSTLALLPLALLGMAVVRRRAHARR